MLPLSPSPAPSPLSSPPTLLAHLATVPDPRIERTRRHQLVDILAITLLATLRGADAYTEIAQYGRTHEAWLKSFLQLPNGIPSHDTFERVLGRLDRHAFERCFAEWASAVAVLATGEVIAIDGKTARRSRDASHHPIHAVSAWATRQQLVLGQVRTEEKSNEITAIPELLKLLDIKDCTVTIDAMGCQKEITSGIRAKRVDYLLTLKGNQTWPRERVANFFTNFFKHADEVKDEPRWRGVPREAVKTVEKDHGRIEKRHYEEALHRRAGRACAHWRGYRQGRLDGSTEHRLCCLRAHAAHRTECRGNHAREALLHHELATKDGPRGPRDPQLLGDREPMSLDTRLWSSAKTRAECDAAMDRRTWQRSAAGP